MFASCDCNYGDRWSLVSTFHYSKATKWRSGAPLLSFPDLFQFTGSQVSFLKDWNGDKWFWNLLNTWGWHKTSLVALLYLPFSSTAFANITNLLGKTWSKGISILFLYPSLTLHYFWLNVLCKLGMVLAVKNWT